VAAFTRANNLGLPVEFPQDNSGLRVDTHNRQDIVFARASAGSWLAPSSPRDLAGGLKTEPQRYALHPNAPNPFAPRTEIRFDLPQAGPVRLEVFDVAGRRVRNLVHEQRTAGSHRIAWNGLDDSSRPVASGFYLYRLVAGDFSQTRRMVLIR
jgi:hypothetical protein